MPAGKAPVGDTRVQFYSDQIRLLVFHETQLATYDASKMERIRQVERLLIHSSLTLKFFKKPLMHTCIAVDPTRWTLSTTILCSILLQWSTNLCHFL